jgi:3-phosphoshikimate 1-carboxyvinyltransferase
MFAALASGTSEIRNLPSGEDVLSTARCLRALGADIDQEGETSVVRSSGFLQDASTPLDCGNSGTTMRLLSGILAGQPFRSCLTGDESLSRRPMSRVVEPLTRMGARIESRKGHAPLEIHGSCLKAIDYATPVASAQIKSAVLLAGLFAAGTTTVREPVLSRDHTERMLTSLGVNVNSSGPVHSVQGGRMPQPFQATIPGDPSSAAFLTVAACLTEGDVRVRNVLLNPTRSGLFAALREMGSEIDEQPTSESLGEILGVVRGRGEPSTALRLLEPAIPTLIDEIPLLVLAATQLPGTSHIRGVSELRVKETDRIRATAESLNKMGADVEEHPDGFVVRGATPLSGASVDSGGDHRIAMMLAVAGLIADGVTVIEGAECASISWPGFTETLATLGADIGVE